MLYITIFILIFILAAIEWKKNNDGLTRGNIIFLILSSLLTIISAIRYGSGSDYFGYMWHYNNTSSNIIEALSSKTHMNPGFKAIMCGFRALNFTYEDFIFVLSIVLMSIITYLIFKNSKLKIMSLFIFYSMYYQIYINSALRQGLTLIIFLLAFYTLLKKGKVISYFIVILVGSLFHYSILITLIVPLIEFIYRNWNNKRFNIFIILLAFISFIFKGERLLSFIARLIGIEIPYVSSSANIMALALRIILLLFIVILYKCADKNKISDFDKFTIYTYFMGVVIFISISNMPVLSRLTEFFSILDIFIIPNLISYIDFKSLKLLLLLIITLVIGIVFLKDQNSFIYQGSYYYENLIKYPYVTIFNKDDIMKKRYIEHRYRPDEFKYNVRVKRNNIIGDKLGQIRFLNNYYEFINQFKSR